MNTRRSGNGERPRAPRFDARGGPRPGVRGHSALERGPRGRRRRRRGRRPGIDTPANLARTVAHPFTASVINIGEATRERDEPPDPMAEGFVAWIVSGNSRRNNPNGGATAPRTPHGHRRHRGGGVVDTLRPGGFHHARGTPALRHQRGTSPSETCSRVPRRRHGVREASRARNNTGQLRSRTAIRAWCGAPVSWSMSRSQTASRVSATPRWITLAGTHMMTPASCWSARGSSPHGCVVVA